MSLPYTPALADALEDAAVRVRFDDPGDAVYVHDYDIVTARWFFKPVQDELMALLAGAVARKQYQRTYTCLSTVAVGDPLCISGNDQLRTAVSSDDVVLGFCAYKPTTTTAYLSHFYYKSGLVGYYAGQPYYLPGTTNLLGVCISGTEAILFASPATAIMSKLLVSSSVNAASTTALANPASRIFMWMNYK